MAILKAALPANVFRYRPAGKMSDRLCVAGQFAAAVGLPVTA